MVNKKLEYDDIVWALEKTGGNQAAAARLLEVSDSTIYRRVGDNRKLQYELDRIKKDEALAFLNVQEDFDTDEVIEAIIKAEANLTNAARILETNRRTIYNYIRKYERVEEAYQEAKEIRLDVTIDAIMKNVRKGNHVTQIYVAKTQGRHRGWGQDPEEEKETRPLTITLPADSIAGSFVSVYRAIKRREKNEIVLAGGRGSTKSSFSSLIMVELLINNPEMHGLALRNVFNTCRDSVFSQIQWAIDYLGLTDKFHSTKSPLEITYKETDQKIYFRGADDPLKIKSIKPQFGYIGVLWFEELDQFAGPSAVRSIVQSAMRGGDDGVIIKSYNPPRSKQNWVNKEEKTRKENRLLHRSTYLDVPEDWLGSVFLDEAQHLKEINPDAYDHEYLGIAVGTGGIVFENVELRDITDEEIEKFERPLDGLDWGYYPEPAHYNRVAYDPNHLTLYIFDELRRFKTGNKQLWEDLKEECGLTPKDTLWCDSAEPKSIGDFRDYGASARAAEKGPESVRYSMKWLQSLKKIVIDDKRCPHTAQEFLNYEYEQDKDGNYISSYPDKDNHGVDATRYATNRIWVRRGQ